jgi:drug/metabolite transporter (DMT)-like permease
MKRVDWIELGPSFVVASGMVVAMEVATHVAGRVAQTMGSVAVLAAAALAADVWNRQLRGRSARPSWAAVLLIGGFAGAIPLFGIVSWTTLLNRQQTNGVRCAALPTSQGRS